MSITVATSLPNKAVELTGKKLALFPSQLTASVRQCAIHGVTALGKPSRVGGIPHQRKGGRVFVIFDTDGEVIFTGARMMTKQVFKRLSKVNYAYFRLRHQYHVW